MSLFTHTTQQKVNTTRDILRSDPQNLVALLGSEARAASNRTNAYNHDDANV